jgi:hypothetical protein
MVDDAAQLELIERAVGRLGGRRRVLHRRRRRLADRSAAACASARSARRCTPRSRPPSSLARSARAPPAARRDDGLRGADRRGRRRAGGHSAASGGDPRDAGSLGTRAGAAARGDRGGRRGRRARRAGAGARQRRRHGQHRQHGRRACGHRGRGRLGLCTGRRCSTPTAPSPRVRRRCSRCRSCGGPGRGVVTALGGGYLASGSGDARACRARTSRAACVSTGRRAPARCRRRCWATPPTSLEIGDRVYMRHAKAGELCERFASLHLIEGERIVESGADATAVRDNASCDP